MSRTGILLCIAVLLVAMVLPAHAEEFRGFWVDAWHSGYENATATQTMVDYVKGCNSNAVIVEVRKRGDAYYASTMEPQGINITPAAGYDSLADVCAKAHAQGLEVHAWVVTYRVWTSQTAPTATTPDHVFNTHPEWFNLTSTGAKFATNDSFLDPGHPGVENFNNDVFMEIVGNYDVDAIVLDYIRYPGTTWGYNPTAVARYNAEYGTTGSPSTTDTRWSNWRRDQITNMVKRVYLEAKAIKPYIKVGAAVWKTSPTGNSGYFQDWNLWMQNHWLDYASPMNYTTTNSTYDSNNADNYGRMYGHHVYPAQGSYMNTISNTVAQIVSTQSMGFPGVTPYSYAVPNSGTVDRAGFQNALLAGPFASPEPTPAMSWVASPMTGMLKGFVTDAVGNAAYPATVTIGSASTKNSGTGFYGFVDLAPGTYTVTATGPNQVTGSGTVTVAAGQVASLDITLGQVDSEPPTVPASLNAVAVSSTRVDLTWAASTDNIGVSGYKVFRNGAQIGTSTTTGYSDTACAANTAYAYEVSAYDAAGNESLRSTAAAVTTPGLTVKSYAPDSITLTRGAVTSGSVTNLSSNDASYLVVSGRAQGKTYYIDWYSTAQIAENPSSVKKLTISFDGKQSTAVTRYLYIYNWSTSGWTQIDARSVGATDVTSTWSTSAPANYVSSTGQIRVRQYSTRKGALSGSADLAQFTIEF